MATAQQALVMISAGSAPPAASTWNPSDKDSEIVLSSGNMAAAHPSGTEAFRSVRGTLSRSAGLKYFTVTAAVISPGSNGAVLIGIADASCTLSLGYIGQHTSSAFKKSVGLWCKDLLMHNMTGAAGQPAATGYAAGAVVGVLVDFSAFNIKFYNDATGVLLGQFTDTGPWIQPFFPAVSLYLGGSVSTLNCGGPFTNLPSGASAWDS